MHDDDAELDVDGQPGNGKRVRVDDVQISRSDGFVVVCSLDTKRQLGVSQIPRSTDDRSVWVTLDEPITRRARLLLFLLADNGDGTLDWASDPRVFEDEDDPDDPEVETITYRYSD